MLIDSGIAWSTLVGVAHTQTHPYTLTRNQSQVESLFNKYFYLFLLGKDLRVDPRYSLVKQIKSALEFNQAEVAATPKVSPALSGKLQLTVKSFSFNPSEN